MQDLLATISKTADQIDLMPELEELCVWASVLG